MYRPFYNLMEEVYTICNESFDCDNPWMEKFYGSVCCLNSMVQHLNDKEVEAANGFFRVINGFCNAIKNDGCYNNVSSATYSRGIDNHYRGIMNLYKMEMGY